MERYREGFGRLLDPFTRRLASAGVSPDVLSWTSLVFALAAAVTLSQATASRPGLLVLAAAFIAANGILDIADGHLARRHGTASPRGDYLDHVLDRYSDAAILLGLTFNPAVDWRLGTLAIVGTFLTSYMGTQAQALGLGREYRGLLGRADRLVLLIAAPVVEAARLSGWVPLPAGWTALNLVLAWFALAGNLTAIQRFAMGWRELRER